MKAKKLAALGLSAALSLSLASPAFAASNTTTKITGTYQEIPIAVTVPTTGTATINPYGLPVKVQSTNTTGDKKDLLSINGQKITTMPMAIYSKTEVGLLVSATVTGEIKGENLKLATAAIPDGTTTNTALIYLETKASKLLEANLAVADSTTKVGPFEGWNTTSDAAVTDVTEEITTWGASTYSADARNQIIVSTSAKSKSGIGYLTGTGTDDDDLKAGGAMWFRLAGDVVSAPKTAWTKSDGVSVTVAFTFAPATSAGSPGTIKVPATVTHAQAVTLEIDAAATHLTFGDGAKYAWSVDEGDLAAATFSTTEGKTESDATPEITFPDAGTYKVTLKVTENNVPYVTEIDVTVV